MSALLGVLSGGLGSWVSRAIGIYEKKMQQDHELLLLDMQMKVARAETESEIAIAREESYATIREASYKHDASVGEVSLYVRNILRMVRPVLTLFLIFLVGAIWFTLAEHDVALKTQIVEGILYMASTALTWWFGDRTPHAKKLSWQ